MNYTECVTEQEKEQYWTDAQTLFAGLDGWIEESRMKPPYSATVILLWQIVYVFSGKKGEKKITLGHRTHTDAAGEHYHTDDPNMSPVHQVIAWMPLPGIPREDTDA